MQMPVFFRLLDVTRDDRFELVDGWRQIGVTGRVTGSLTLHGMNMRHASIDCNFPADRRPIELESRPGVMARRLSPTASEFLQNWCSIIEGM